ncbi:serine/threonine-protein phosphatase 6 regulatory ankyrin repeat subunit A-like [Haliotis asinina]|uniref:serine/threonine-protein phosphatase 6 regulatory ankyrin repeat subunit A-like n=1 Tax=Haliotis asinina TaxID=109174 RepID=UPI0035319776
MISHMQPGLDIGYTQRGVMKDATEWPPTQTEDATGSQAEGENIASTIEDQGVTSEKRTVVIYMAGASKHADEVEALLRSNDGSIQWLQYDDAMTFKEAINTDCSCMVVLIEEQFSELLEDEYRICKDVLTDLVEAEKDMRLISYLDDVETDHEVKYKLPKAMRKHLVHHTRVPKGTNGYVTFNDHRTTIAQVGNNNHIEVKPGADSTNTLQVRRSNRFSTSSGTRGAKRKYDSVRTEPGHKLTAKQRRQEARLKSRRATEAARERQTADTSEDRVALDEVRSEEPNNSHNGALSTNDHRTTAAQVGNNNHIEVKPGADNTNAFQVGSSNRFSTSSDHPTTAAQFGNNNHIEVKPGAGSTNSSQVGRSNTFSVSSGPSIQGYKLTITAPGANYELYAEIKKHIDSNIDDINISLKPLNTRVESTSLGSVIISVTVEPGTKLGPIWLREVITKILSEDIFAKLPNDTRMGVNISASLPLTPLDVDIFEHKGEKWITDYKSDFIRKSKFGRSMLHQAARLGNRSAVILTLKSGSIVDDQDFYGNTALHYAAVLRENSASVSRLLVEGGATIEKVNRDGCTPLHCAVAKRNLETVELFAEAFGVNDSTHTSSNLTDISHLTQLMVKHGADVNAVNKEKLTPLHVAASSKSFDVIGVLLTEGADANAVDKNGQTPLHHLFGSNLETASVTETSELKATHTDTPDNDGASKAPSSVFDIPDSKGNTPLHSALKANFTKGAITLVKAGARVNAKNNIAVSPLHLLAGNTNMKSTRSENDAVQMVIEYSRDISVKDNRGYTPLMMAVENNKDISPLLKAGADINDKDHKGKTLLMTAIERNSRGIEVESNLIPKLIAGGANVNARDNKGNTPLMLAIKVRPHILSLMSASQLIATGADVNAQDKDGNTDGKDENSKNISDKTALHFFSQNDYDFDTRTISQLIAAGADVNAQDNDGNTTLMTSVTAGHDISSLLRAGADVNSKNKSGKTALHLVSKGVFDNGTRTISQLIAAGAGVNAQDNDGNTPLMTSVTAGHDISSLLGAGADVNSKNKSGKTALHLVSKGVFDIGTRTISQLIAAGADVNAQDNDGNTPLMTSVTAGHDISSLLRAGADVNSKNKSGKTALHLVSKGVFDIGTRTISQLIAAGADVNAQDNDGNTPLMTSVTAGHDISSLFGAGADVNSKNKSGKTALHHVSRGVFDIGTRTISQLIAAGADVNAQDNDGNTPLMTFATAGHDISSLLGAGADVNSKNNSGKTALHLVSKDVFDIGRARTISPLIAAGADVNAQDKDGNTSLVTSVTAGHDIFSLLTDVEDVNSKNKSGKTALHHVSKGVFDIGTRTISQLIAAGADVNAQDNDGNTPLMTSVTAGHISSLLGAGADVNSKNKSGKTALHFFSENDYDFDTWTISQLIDVGADVNAQDDDGNTPLHVCVQNNSYNKAMVLLQNPLSSVNMRNRHGQSVLSLVVDAGERLSPAKRIRGRRSQTYLDTPMYSKYPLNSRETMIQAILNKSSDLNYEDKRGGNFLRKAKSRNFLEFGVRFMHHEKR